MSSLETTKSPVTTTQVESLTLAVRDDFDSETLSPFWNTGTAEAGSLTPTTLEGKKCLKITVHPGDKSKRGGSGQGTERAEIGELKENLFPAGVEAWYGVSFLVPNDFPINNNRLVIAQWKALKSGEQLLSPVISVRYQNGKLIGQIIDGSKRIKFDCPNITQGEWHKITVNFNIDENHSGYCKFFLDGKMFGEYSGHMGYDELSAQMHFRMGLYRDELPYEQSLYFSEFCRGNSKEFCDDVANP